MWSKPLSTESRLSLEETEPYLNLYSSKRHITSSHRYTCWQNSISMTYRKWWFELMCLKPWLRHGHAITDNSAASVCPVVHRHACALHALVHYRECTGTNEIILKHGRQIYSYSKAATVLNTTATPLPNHTKHSRTYTGIIIILLMYLEHTQVK